MAQHSSSETARVFTPAFDALHAPERAQSLGAFYPMTEVGAARLQLAAIVREARPAYDTSAAGRMEEAVRWTRCINELNKGRVWPQKLLLARLDPMLEPGIAIVTVPSHDPFRFTPPLRLLAQKLAARGRIDATGCLVRHTRIARILFGGPSTPALHRQTIRIEDAARFAGQRVLLLDDIVKSGASLLACRELLLEAGALSVQALALGRVSARP